MTKMFSVISVDVVMHCTPELFVTVSISQFLDTKTSFSFSLGEFVRANKQKANVIGW